MKIGELYVTYEFDTPADAARAWERVNRDCRYLGVFRWALPEDFERQFVTVLAEAENAGQFQRACKLLARDGTGVLTPQDTLDACRARRTRRWREGSGRTSVRSPGGFRVDQAGGIHPARKPQG